MNNHPVVELQGCEGCNHVDRHVYVVTSQIMIRKDNKSSNVAFAADRVLEQPDTPEYQTRGNEGGFGSANGGGS